MNKIIGVIMCFVPFPVFANDLQELPFFYIDIETRAQLNDYPATIDNGYVLIETISQAQTFFNPIPPDVDFDNQNVLMFAWGGSGGDKIDYDRDEDAVYHFVLKRGLTRDYRLHTKIYVLKKSDQFLFHRVLE
jgi:hypothetical protein